MANVPERARQTEPQAAAEQNDFVSNLIAGLPELQREVIVMLNVEGMSLDEMAKATSSSVGVVKQKAHRA